MQPNSRWYTGAGIFRSVELLHFPKLHIADEGIFGYTKSIEYDSEGNALRAHIRVEIQVQNNTLDNKMAGVSAFLTKDGSDEVIISRSQKIQVNPASSETWPPTDCPT